MHTPPPLAPLPRDPRTSARPGPRPRRLGVAAVGIAALAVGGTTVPPSHAQDPAPRQDGVLSVEPGELDFGRVDLGSRVDGVVTARNNGTGPLTFGGASLLGAQARDFGLVPSGSPRCVSGLELGPGGFCEIVVRFTRSAGGARTATLSVTASGTTLPARLTGAGSAAPAGPGDTTAPTVVAVRPAAGAERVSRDATVVALFSEAVRGVSRTTFTLTDLRTRRAVATRLLRVGRRWRLDPVGRLSAATSYRVRLAGAIRDAAGNTLAPRGWRFTTRR